MGGPKAAVLRPLVADATFGAMPALLLALTVVTGVVDAVSILALGRVFVANMTGNVVFVGFAVVGAPGFSLSASLAALAGFLVGARVAGSLVIERVPDKNRRFVIGLAAEVVLFAAALLVVALGGARAGGAAADLAVSLLGVAMGIQNGVVRSLAVPDLTTTVLTMTLTGIASEARSREVVTRRVLAVLAMFAGAVMGALLVLHSGAEAGLGCVTGLAAVVAAGAWIDGVRARTRSAQH